MLGKAIRGEFPIYSRYPDGLSFLDSAASSFKPGSVIKRLSDYLSFEHANIHRGAYALSAKATEYYEEAREKIASFLNCQSSSLVFTKGATEAINLVANAYGANLKEGDTILLSLLEHHSNIVPWQLLGELRGVKLAFAPIDDNAGLDLAQFQLMLKEMRPKIVSITYVSNAFGSVLPVKELIELSRKHGAKVLIDACQAVAHKKIDLKLMDPDFLVFSGHKLYGPTGIGILYTRPELQAELRPYQGGGDMIRTVSTTGSTFMEYPQKFEAGTPPIAEAIGLGASIDFISQIGMKKIAEHEAKVLATGVEKLSAEPHVKLYGPVSKGDFSGSIVPFNVEGVHPHDISTVSDSLNVQIRAGHHCAMPALNRLGLKSTARASVGVYSDTEDFDRLIEGIRKAVKLFR